jgi:hypothetical protein
VIPLFPQLPAFVVELDGKKSKELSRFRSSDDVDYKKIIERMQSSLIFKSSISEALQPRLEYFVKRKFPLDSTEHRGRTPLHWAASAPDLDAAALLIKERRALVNVKANDKQTPLHRAVKWAAKVKASDTATREKFSHMIEKLIENSLRIDAMDDENKTAWEYAESDDKRWDQTLKNLKNKSRLIPGPSKAGSVTSVLVGKPKGDQAKALLALKALLVEVFLGGENDDFSDFLIPAEPRMFDLVYDDQGGLQKILAEWRPESVSDRQPECRWVHLPANNVSRPYSSGRQFG